MVKYGMGHGITDDKTAVKLLDEYFMCALGDVIPLIGSQFVVSVMTSNMTRCDVPYFYLSQTSVCLYDDRSSILI